MRKKSFKVNVDNICDCSSSSDEDDDYYHDNQLRSDIHQLEAALSNVEDKLDQRKHKRLVKKQ